MGKKKKKMQAPTQKSSKRWDDMSDFEDDDYGYESSSWGFSLEDEEDEDEHTSFDYEAAAQEMNRSRQDRHYGR